LGNRLEDRELPKRIDARRYPTISGVLTGVVPVADDGRFLVRGDLTFRGVTRSAEDYMTLTAVEERTIRLAGGSAFDVRDFGLEPPRILLLRVEPDVNVRVEIFAEGNYRRVHELDLSSSVKPLGLFGVHRPVRDARISRRVTAAPVELAHAFESSEGFKLLEIVRDDPGVEVAADVGNLPQFNAHIFGVGRHSRLVDETRNSSEERFRIDHHS
jgi:YceI-like domain